MTIIYAYRLTHDTGFAPCVDNGLLSLACCKGGYAKEEKLINTNIRYWIGSGRNNTIDYKKDHIYVLGVYQGRFLYLARITEAVKMKEYFSPGSRFAGRLDQIYNWTGEEFIRNDHLKKEDIHTSKKDWQSDAAGVYVLLSTDFIYLGKDSVGNTKILSGAPAGIGYKEITGDEAEEIIKECERYRDDRIHKPSEPIKDKCKSGGNCSRQKRTKGKGSCS